MVLMSDGLSSRQSQAKQRLGRVDDHHQRLTRGLRDDISSRILITTQQIPPTLAEWSKNRGKLPFVMQSRGNIAGFLGERLSETEHAKDIY